MFDHTIRSSRPASPPLVDVTVPAGLKKGGPVDAVVDPVGGRRVSQKGGLLDGMPALVPPAGAPTARTQVKSMWVDTASLKQQQQGSSASGSSRARLQLEQMQAFQNDQTRSAEDQHRRFEPLKQKALSSAAGSGKAMSPGDFVNSLYVPPANRHRGNKVGELQTLNAVQSGKKYSVGVVTRYPETPSQVAALLRRSVKSPNPHAINFMKRGDMGIDQSYVDKIPENQTVDIGGLKVRKGRTEISELGPNAEGEPTLLEETTLRVRDPAEPEKGWRDVRYSHVENWPDGTTPPLKTFEATWRALYKNTPRAEQEVLVNCAGGVGRTPTGLLRLAVQHHIDSERKRGHVVTLAESQKFVGDLVVEGRRIRGDQFMADPDQLALVMKSVELELEQNIEQNRKKAGETGAAGRAPAVSVRA